MTKQTRTKNWGFTIVELLIVIVVIAILAVIITVAYNGITQQAHSSSAQAAVREARAKILSHAVTNNEAYPDNLASVGISSSATTVYSYTVDNTGNPKTFCVDATTGSTSYYASEAVTSPASGTCSGGGGGESLVMQTVTGADCVTDAARRVVDARDNHTYWMKRLVDGNCWMLTNLAYAGGGDNTYGDTRTMTDGAGQSASFTAPHYYVLPLSPNYTVEPNDPSTSTDGTGQSGYGYNFCAATGGQSGNGSCSSSSSASVNTTVSVCPAGWRLPGGSGNAELVALNTAMNGTSGSAAMLSDWQAQLAGYWVSGSFAAQGTTGVYWSSSQYSATVAYYITITASTSTTFRAGKSGGYSVRCLLMS